jgi:hypothetical protein
MDDVKNLKNKRSQTAAKSKEIVATVDHKEQQQMGRRKVKSKLENNDKEVKAKRTRHDEK